MNKLITLIIVAISFGLVASQAMADDYLDASDFFYGESIVDPVEVNFAAVPEKKADISGKTIALTASDFFYGYAAGNQVEPVHASDLQPRTDVASSPVDQITPEIFYGYSDVKTVIEKCACTECKC